MTRNLSPLAGATSHGLTLRPAGSPGPWRVEIPLWQPTLLNKLVGKHPMVVSRLKGRDAMCLYASLLLADVPRAHARRKLTMTLVSKPGQCRCDADAPWKSLLDGLVQIGALVDDADAWVLVEPLQYATAPARSTILELCDIPNL